MASNTAGRRSGLVVAALLAIAMIAGVAVGVGWWQHRAGGGALAGERLTEFPALNRGALDPRQAAVVAVAEREFAEPGPGTKYAEGVVEAWCADFVSWVMREAGYPLSNPHSGSWRIPGVYTLQEYYEAAGRFVPLGTGSAPRAGDVLLYAPGSPFGQHTNLVLAAEDGVVTTLGGNEFGEIRLHRFTLAEVPGILGIGRL